MVFFLGSKETILLKCLETSTMIPLPIVWPAKDVPAVLGVIEILFFEANRIIFIISFSDFGIATARGIIL
ncbi:hypothetical protein D3C80_1398560 [compost metagenome]